MRMLKAFIEDNSVEKSDSLVNKDFLKKVEEYVGTGIGPKLSEYILYYGYLMFDSIELYGITDRQGMESDLIKQSKYLHEYFEKTNGYYAMENLGDGDYSLVDSADRVFDFDSELDEIKDTGLNLEEYIVKRFIETKQLF